MTTHRQRIWWSLRIKPATTTEIADAFGYTRKQTSDIMRRLREGGFIRTVYDTIGQPATHFAVGPVPPPRYVRGRKPGIKNTPKPMPAMSAIELERAWARPNT